MPEEYESCLPEIKALGYTINWKSEWEPGIKEHDVLTAYGRFAYAQFVSLTLRVSIAHTPYLLRKCSLRSRGERSSLCLRSKLLALQVAKREHSELKKLISNYFQYYTIIVKLPI